MTRSFILDAQQICFSS